MSSQVPKKKKHQVTDWYWIEAIDKSGGNWNLNIMNIIHLSIYLGPTQCHLVVLNFAYLLLDLLVENLYFCSYYIRCFYKWYIFACCSWYREILLIFNMYVDLLASQVALVVKKPPANENDTRKWSQSCSVMSDSVTSWTIQSLEFSRSEYWGG